MYRKIWHNQFRLFHIIMNFVIHVLPPSVFTLVASWRLPWVTYVNRIMKEREVLVRKPSESDHLDDENGAERTILKFLKYTVFWDVVPCRSCVHRRFGGTYRLHLQDCSLQPSAHAGSSLTDFFTLTMEAIRSSETSVHTRSTRRHIPEDGIPQSLNYLIRSHWFYQFTDLRCKQFDPVVYFYSWLERIVIDCLRVVSTLNCDSSLTFNLALLTLLFTVFI
jgi:hypothetical protein